jgi:undecaprenyl-diphosphatase
MDYRGVGVAGPSALVVPAPQVPMWEEQLFRRMNAGIGAAERPVWLVMQAGNGLAAIVAPAALRLQGHSWRESLRVGLAAGGAWHLAKGVKALVRRGRPSALMDDVVLRDGNPDGYGFVSGHAAVAMSVAVATAPLVSDRARVALFATALAVAYARVHVGAHLPLDVAGSLALAAVWGSLVAPRGSGR